MAKTRLDRWKNPVRIASGFIDSDDEQMERLLKLRKPGVKSEKLTTNSLIGACKELIYDVCEGDPVFHGIMYSISANRIEIQLCHVFDIHVSHDDPESYEQQIRNTLAIATMQGVPVYPNTSDLVSEVAGHHKAMLTHGFTAPDEEGARIQLSLTKKGGAKKLSADSLEDLDATVTYFPAEIELIRQSLRDELKRRDHAGRLLAALNLAISDLQELLDSKKRNEAKLQHCLTNNPILFGINYVRVIPKHRLGSEYEMDYALEQTSGHFDLVEIESSSLNLFTAKGNPTSYLVHAEQQVLDWLAWIEKNNSYARENLPGIASPIGFVVIGTHRDLTAECERKLKQRNLLFMGRIQILTYDDLLKRARNLLSHLEGLST